MRAGGAAGEQRRTQRRLLRFRLLAQQSMGGPLPGRERVVILPTRNARGAEEKESKEPGPGSNPIAGVGTGEGGGGDGWGGGSPSSMAESARMGERLQLVEQRAAHLAGRLAGLEAEARDPRGRGAPVSAQGLEKQVARLKTEVRRAPPLSYPGHKAFQPLVEHLGFY